MNKSTPKGCTWLVLFLLLLSACQPVQSNNAASETPFFKPPTPIAYQAPTSSPLPLTTSGPTLPPSNAACTDSLTFITDASIPDGTVVEPEATLDKRWEVENSGNCNWNENYRLRLVAGPEMGAQPEQALYPARSGARAVIRIVFKAPTEPGNYSSAWQAVSPDGEPFGDQFFIVINVQ